MATTVQGVPLVAVTEQPLQPPATLNKLKHLAIAQVVIGILTGILGIAAITLLYINKWTKTGAGIWAGGWVTFTGLAGIAGIRDKINTSIYMVLNIISTCVSFIAGLLFTAAIIYYVGTFCYDESDDNLYDNPFGYINSCCYRSGYLGLFIPSLILIIIEFFVSFASVIYCCQNRYDNHSSGGVVIQQQQYAPVPTSSKGPVVMTTSMGYPSGVQYGGQMAPQYGGQMTPQYGGQMASQYGGQVVPQYGMQMQPQYNAKLPPPYNVVTGETQPTAYPVQQM